MSVLLIDFNVRGQFSCLIDNFCGSNNIDEQCWLTLVRLPANSNSSAVWMVFDDEDDESLLSFKTVVISLLGYRGHTIFF